MDPATRALILVGHGSHLSPDSSAPVYAHAARIRELGVFDEVVEAFWKEEPSLRDAIDLVSSGEIFIVPLFLAEGYFTRQLVPRELGIADGVRADGRTIHYCRPVGAHPAMRDLIQERVRTLTDLSEDDRRRTTLVIIGHGTDRSETSGDTTYRLASGLSETGEFGAVHCGFLDEDPRVEDVLAKIVTPYVVLVPFFVAEGWHTATTIPRELGLSGEVTTRNGQTIWYSAPVGTLPRMTDVVVAVAADAGALASSRPGTAGSGEDGALATLRRAAHRRGAEPPRGVGTGSEAAVIDRARNEFRLCLGGTPHQGTRTILQLSIRRRGAEAYRITHVGDVGRPDVELEAIADWRDLSTLVRTNPQGAYRPLRSRNDLRGGWVLAALTPDQVWEVVSLIYPGALLQWYRFRTGTLDVVPFADWAARQTGIYEGLGDLAPEALSAVIRECCGSCLRRRIWSSAGQEGAEEAPGDGEAVIPCREPCTLFATHAREARG